MAFFDNRDLSTAPSISEFYKNKTIFITGGSGFMGKVLIEKLLYSCPDLDRIYLLLRSKKGVKPEDRLTALYSSMCFDRLRKEKPTIFEEKVFFIAGDCGELGLGISDEDRTLIINRTNIIFHSAASVRFDDSLKVACKLNLQSTREVIELAKEVRNLEVFVHVSTSYANTTRKCIDEVIYPAFADWRNTLEISEKMDEHTLKVLTSKYLGELPNTYVFTKQLAEHVVSEQQGKLPIAIIRPSIVVPSNAEPMVGWIENLNGPVGMFIASGKGILRSLYSDPDVISDYIPVDIAIKSFIVAAWERGTKKLEPTDEIRVYNCSSNNSRRLTMGEIVEYGKTVLKEIPLEGTLWHAGGSLTTSKFMYNFKVLFYHFLPALLVDLVLKMSGGKPMLTKLQRRIYIANLALQYFVTQQWKFNNQNILTLRSKIKEEDIQDFVYDLETIVPQEFFKNGIIGGKVFILKEKMEDLPKAKQRYRRDHSRRRDDFAASKRKRENDSGRMELLDKVVSTLIRGYLCWFILTTSFVSNILHSIYSLVLGF